MTTPGRRSNPRLGPVHIIRDLLQDHGFVSGTQCRSRSHIAVVPSRCAHGQATEVAKRCELIAGNDLQARYDIIRWYISNGRLAYVELRAAASACQCGQPPTAQAPMNAGPWGPDRLVDEEAKRR